MPRQNRVSDLPESTAGINQKALLSLRSGKLVVKARILSNLKVSTNEMVDHCQTSRFYDDRFRLYELCGGDGLPADSRTSPS